VIRPKRTVHKRASLKGQSLVEMALILPVLLAVAGGATDLSRAYAAWTSLESATRNAAEYVATNSPDAATAITDAKRVVCAETQGLPGYVTGSPYCTSPSVTVTWSSCDNSGGTCPGGTVQNPIRTARVVTSLQFQTLVPWPLIPRTGFNLSADRRYSIAFGR
jgi:Flp pilus assembly protein TadG